MTREEQIIEASQLYAKHLQKPFVDGALWADRHPKDDPFEGILIHGNNDAYRLGYKKAIDKACEWLKDYVSDYLDRDKQYQLPIIDVVELITDFRKEMEEQQ